MAISLTAFLPLLKAWAPAVPNPVALQFLRLAAREFCKDTRCWRERLTVDVTENPFTIGPDYTTVVAVQDAMFGDREITPGILSDIAINTLDETGQPDRLFQIEDEGAFWLHPFTAGDLDVIVFLAPQAGPQFGSDGDGGTHQANQVLVPDALFHEHADSIAAGALGHLLTLPNQSYTNGELALFHMARFEKAKTAMKGKELKGKQRAPTRARASFF